MKKHKNEEAKRKKDEDDAKKKRESEAEEERLKKKREEMKQKMEAEEQKQKQAEGTRKTSIRIFQSKAKPEANKPENSILFILYSSICFLSTISF